MAASLSVTWRIRSFTIFSILLANLSYPPEGEAKLLPLAAVMLTVKVRPLAGAVRSGGPGKLVTDIAIKLLTGKDNFCMNYLKAFRVGFLNN